MLNLNVRCFNGKKIQVTAPNGSRTTVGELQAAVESQAGIPPSSQMIMYKGKVLDSTSENLEVYGIGADLSEATLSVVRNVGGTSSSDAPAQSQTTRGGVRPSRAGSSGKSGTNRASNTGAASGSAELDNLARQLRQMSAASSGGRSGGAPDLAQQNSILEALMGGSSAGSDRNSNSAGGMDPTALMSQMSQMMGGLWDSPVMQEYLTSPDKQEESRQALLSNPFLRQWMDSDPQFREVVEDPSKWKESMQAAKELFATQGQGQGQGSESLSAAMQSLSASAGSRGTRETVQNRNQDQRHSDEQGVDEDTDDDMNAARASAQLRDERTAELAAEQGLNMRDLSVGYGFALGQALLNSGFGLDHDLVLRGLRDALAGKEFPMSMPEYERQMGILQGIANEVVGEANLQEAQAFFDTAKSMSDLFKPLENDRILWEEMDIMEEADEKTSATKGKKCSSEASNVTMVLQGRLLDGRFFFTCPADEKGEMISPLTLNVSEAPPALKRAIVDMSEGESRTIYVHPEACDGMEDMFGQMLPKNALLIFDLELIQVDVPNEDS